MLEPPFRCLAITCLPVSQHDMLFIEQAPACHRRSHLSPPRKKLCFCSVLPTSVKTFRFDACFFLFATKRNRTALALCRNFFIIFSVIETSPEGYPQFYASYHLTIYPSFISKKTGGFSLSFLIYYKSFPVKCLYKSDLNLSSLASLSFCFFLLSASSFFLIDFPTTPPKASPKTPPSLNSA